MPRMIPSPLPLWMTTRKFWVTTASGTGNSSRFVFTRMTRYASPITMCIQIADTNPSITFTGQLSDVSQVEKFELSEEAYAQRNGNLVFTFRRMLYADFPAFLLQIRSSRTNNVRNSDVSRKSQMKNHREPKRMSISKLVLDAKSNRPNQVSTNAARYDSSARPSLLQVCGSGSSTTNRLGRTTDR